MLTVNSSSFYTSYPKNNNLQNNSCILLVWVKNSTINKTKQRLERAVKTLDFPKLIIPNPEEPQTQKTSLQPIESSTIYTIIVYKYNDVMYNTPNVHPS